MTGILILGPILLLAVLWWLLDRHEKRRAAAGLTRLSGLRVFLVSAALLATLFTGGCSLLFLANMDGSYVSWQSVGVVGGPPFAVAVLWLVVWMARRDSTFIRILTLVAVFATALCLAALVILTNSTGANAIGYGVGAAALATAIAAVWIFRSRAA